MLAADIAAAARSRRRPSPLLYLPRAPPHLSQCPHSHGSGQQPAPPSFAAALVTGDPNPLLLPTNNAAPTLSTARTPATEQASSAAACLTLTQPPPPPFVPVPPPPDADTAPPTEGQTPPSFPSG
nr:extensin-like [Aegilops tauschii subsp. strangulata]